MWNNPSSESPSNRRDAPWAEGDHSRVGCRLVPEGKHEWVCRRRQGCKQGDRKANVRHMTVLLGDVLKSENYF